MTENINTPQKNQEDDLDSYFEDNRLMLEASDRSRRLMLESQPQPELIELKSSGRDRLKKFGKKATAAALISLGGAFAVHVVSEVAEPKIEFSSEESIYIAPEGGSLWEAAQTVEGSDSVDTRDVVAYIEEHEANVDTLKDGLQARESLVVPKYINVK